MLIGIKVSHAFLQSKNIIFFLLNNICSVTSGREINMYLEVGMTHFYHLTLKTLLLGLSISSGPE